MLCVIEKCILQVDLGLDLDSRVAIVGPNGAGKSTLLKLMTGDLEALDGMVKRHNHLKLGMYHQHLTELLDPKLTPLEYMVSPPPSRSAAGWEHGMPGEGRSWAAPCRIAQAVIYLLCGQMQSCGKYLVCHW